MSLAETQSESPIITPSGSAIADAAQRIRNGGLVAFPTETVYGLGADASQSAAVARIFAVKRRPAFNPLIVHASRIDQARMLAAQWSETAQILAERFWPGPLSIVLPRRGGTVCELATAGLSTVALRIPDHPVALQLLRECRVPVAAPSANRFGSVSPTTAAHVASSLGREIDGVLDGGPCRSGVESTVISLASGKPMLLRPGAVPVEEIEALIGPIERAGPAAGAAQGSPGMLPQHYATRTPIYLDGTQPPDLDSARTGFIVLNKTREFGNAQAVEVLSSSGDLVEAASNLFAAMRRLDDAGLDAIVAQRVPNKGLGLAINDRLTRAAAAASRPCSTRMTDELVSP